jgi:hypothetical protein
MNLGQYETAQGWYAKGIPLFEPLVAQNKKLSNLRTYLNEYAFTLRKLHLDKAADDLLAHWQSKSWVE